MGLSAYGFGYACECGCLWKAEESAASLGAVVSGGGESPRVCWEPNSGSLEEEQSFLTMELPLRFL